MNFNNYKRNLKYFQEIEKSELKFDPSEQTNYKSHMTINFSNSWNMLQDEKTGELYTKLSITVLLIFHISKTLKD